MLKEFTSEIHSNFKESAKVRAEYLYSLYAKSGLNFNGVNYLDVGCGIGANSAAFGKDFKKTFVIDVQKGTKKKNFVQSNAMKLAFKRNSFDLVSMFSIIEHLPDKSAALQETAAILKNKGLLVMQLPNRYFPIDLHNGIPFVHFLPKKIRDFFLGLLGYAEQCSTEIPSRHFLRKLLSRNGYSVLHESAIAYPNECVPKSVRRYYRLLGELGFLTLLPMGYFVIARKVQ